MATRLRKMIEDTDGKFFRVDFIKRSTGEARTMQARLNVTKFLKGGDPAYDPKLHNLIPVWDTQKQAYRSIPLESIFYFKCGDKTYYNKDMARRAGVYTDPDN